MLDIKKVPSTNKVTIMGVLSELNIEEKQTSDGREYVQGVATIKVDQEIGGKTVENEIPVRMFSMRLKKDKTKNAIYDSIVKMKEDFISLAAAETLSQASKVLITSGQIQENIWLDKQTNQPRTGFQISSNFMRKAGADDEENARFELSGVVGDIKEELNKDGEETGRLIVKFIVIGYLGKADVIQLIAENPSAVNHIRTKWEKGDTVTLTGAINMSYTVKTWTEEQGFGEPIKRTRTESKRELIITGGSPCGLEEELSYDMDAVKLALDERQGRIDALSVKKPTNTTSDKSFNVGF
jgi:hypothetical protein